MQIIQIGFGILDAVLAAIALYVVIQIREGIKLMNTTMPTLSSLVTTLTKTVADETTAITAQTAASKAEHDALSKLIADFEATTPSPDQTALLVQMQTAITNAQTATASIVSSTESIQADADAVTAALPAPSNLAITTTTLNAPPTAAAGSNLSISAVVVENPEGAAAPTGSVEFFNGNVESLGKSDLDTTGLASLVVPAIAAGSYSITAVYAGDSANAGSSSSAGTVVVS